MLRALRYPNYRLFFGGQIVSLVGTWITTTATSWLVYRLTGSAVYLGIIGFATQFPAFLLTSVAGIYVDRWNRHRLLVATQVLMMLVSTVLAALTLTNYITIHAIVVVSIVQGLVTAFDLPCRQAFVVSIIEDRNDIGNAIALNSSMFNAARLVGPSVAGAIIAGFGEGWCFALDGVSYLAVIIALLRMQLPPYQRPTGHRHSVFFQFKEGWSYVFGTPAIRGIISLLALVSLVGVPYTILMPVFAGDVLKGGPSTLGLLMTASGGGALLGAVWLASRRSAAGLIRAIAFAAATFGVGLIALAFARTLWVALLFMVLTGFGLMVQAATSNTVLQTIVADEKRGRVMSFFLMAYLGSAPFGSLMAGTLSERLGVAATLSGGGICCVLAAIWFLTKVASFDTTAGAVAGHEIPGRSDEEPDDSITIHTSSAH
jgi:MFS family permease